MIGWYYTKTLYALFQIVPDPSACYLNLGYGDELDKGSGQLPAGTAWQYLASSLCPMHGVYLIPLYFSVKTEAEATLVVAQWSYMCNGVNTTQKGMVLSWWLHPLFSYVDSTKIFYKAFLTYSQDRPNSHLHACPNGSAALSYGSSSSFPPKSPTTYSAIALVSGFLY